MGAILDLTNVANLNPKEVENYSEFITELTFNRPELKALHTFFGDVKMKEQIVLAGQLGKTGLTGTGCARVTSGATSALSDKLWEPVGIEDTFEYCGADLNALFKANFGKITEYQKKFDIEGSETELFIAILIENAMAATAPRAIWLGDKDVAAAEAAVAGLTIAGNAKFYNYFDGIWKQLFTEVTAGNVTKVAIAANAEVTTALQETLAADYAKGLFDEMYTKADPRLRSAVGSKLYVSGGLFQNYRQSLQKVGENFTIDYTVEGFQSLKWNGIDVVNMETVWDIDIKADFVDNTTNEAYFLPNRALYTIPSNIPYASLNESDMTTLETWYNKDTRLYKFGVGFSLDAKFLEGYMAVVAY